MPDPIQTARGEFIGARQAVLDALGFSTLADAFVEELERSQNATDQQLIDARNDKQTRANNLATARAVLETKRTALRNALVTWHNGITPEADLGRMPSASPIVFFPVRLETRFDRSVSPAVLRLRIYPDEIFLDSREAILTPDEVEAGDEFWAAVKANKVSTEEHPPVPIPEADPWTQIVRRMTPERAAYVIRVRERPPGGPFGPDNPPPPGTTFLDVRQTAHTWTRPGEAVLPDYWVILTYRDTTVNRYVTSLVPEPLQLTIDPTHKDTDQVVVPGSTPPIKIEAGLLWTVHYETAEAVGMAKTITLSAAEAAVGNTGGFDKIVVYGVKSSMTPDDTAEHLGHLFDTHHFTRGLAVVPQGTPTNNTEAAPTTVPREDEGSLRVLFEERGFNGEPKLGNRVEPFDTHEDDGDTINDKGRGSKDFSSPLLSDVKALAWLLGVDDGAFPNVLPPTATLGAGFKDFGGHEQARARAMNRVLWPALFGFFVDNILRVPFLGNIVDHDAGRAYFTSWVRARGPAPAFRIGDVPYGVLPVLSTARWAARGTSPQEVLEGKMITMLRLLREHWLRGAANVPRVKAASADPLGDLVKALAIYPSAREVRMRNAAGPLTVFNTSQIGRVDFQGVSDRLIAATAGVFASVGQTDWKQTVLGRTMHDRLASQISADFVVPAERLSETAGLGLSDYFHHFQTVSPAAAPKVLDIFTDALIFNGLSSTLLYRLVRHSLLLDIARAAAALVGPANFPRTQDRESTGIGTGSAAVPTYAQLLARTDFPVTGGLALGDYVFRNNMPADLMASLRQLVGTPTAELDRLLAETMDLASHRLDAWFTALATRRLVEIRDQNEGSENPKRSYLGGYAFIENVRPVAVTTENRPGVGVVEVQAGNGGFIHAPSVAQATAAAILRSGSLAHRAEDPQKYAVDLSSGRVRAARQILDEIRAGQPLAAVLGQRFERRLRDGYPTNLGLDNYRYALRKRYPLVAGKSVPIATGETLEAAAARNVVDGLALATNGITFGPTDLPPSGSPAANALVAELQALRESIDGVSDLVISESVFQLSRGATGTALGNMDALARGGRPPDSELARTIRSGTGLTHRVALVIPDGASLLTTGWPSNPSRRSEVDPVLNDWLAGVLGNPDDVRCLVSLTPTTQNGTLKTKVVKLSQLGSTPAGGGSRVLLHPLDVLALARAVTAPNQGSILDRWIAEAALESDPNFAFASVDYARQGTSRTFPELLEVAATAGELLAGARPLEPGDVSLPAETPLRIEEVKDPARDAAQGLYDLANEEVGKLQVARAPLGAAETPAEIRAALAGVAIFIPAAMPAPGASDDELTASRLAVLDDINRRTAEAATVPAPGANAAELLERAVQILRIVFGDDFVATASFPPPAPGEIQHSLDDRSALLGTTTSEPITKLIQSAAQVQPGLARWRTLGLYMGVTNAPRPRLDVVQLPFLQGERWVARPYENGPPAQHGRVSLVLLSPGPTAPSPSVPWRGLVIDQWVEQIPSASENTGLAFHFDHPLSEAAQTVLVAVPSGVGSNWVYADLVATINETLDLAKIRSVDLELIELGQLLPTSYLAEDAQRNTISTSLGNMRYQATTGTG